jgi:hypothetical protein
VEAWLPGEWPCGCAGGTNISSEKWAAVPSKNADSQTHAISIADFGDKDLWRKPCNEAGSAIDNDVLLTRAMNSAVYYRRSLSDALPHCVAHELADDDISHEELIFVVGQAFQSDHRIVSAAQVDLEAIRERHRFRPCDRRVIGHTRSVLDFSRDSRRRSTPPEKGGNGCLVAAQSNSRRPLM